MPAYMMDEHRNYLTKHFGLVDGADLPKRVLEQYWRTKRLADRSNITLDIRDLMYVALNCGEPLPGERPETFLDVARRLDLKFGAPVVCKWRNGDKDGVFQSITGDGKVLVQLNDGTAEAREFDPEKVRLAADPVTV